MSDTPRPRGRPPLITPDLVEKIVEVMRRCGYVRTSASVLGISQRSIFRWLQRGRREQGRIERERDTGPLPKERLYLALWRSAREATAELELSALASIRKAWESGDWRAAAFFLAARFPEDWGQDRQPVKELKKRLDALDKQINASAPA